MKTKNILRAAIMLIILTSSVISEACTTFVMNDGRHVIFGRNFDFPAGMGQVVINPRNLQKTAFIRPPERPVSWVSKYGSITFNQNGREFPYGGMNEAGLVIEQMWLNETRYPDQDNRYGLSELQWIQYQLDNAGSVQEVIDSDTLVRVSFTSVATLHFLVADPSGDVAAIEYLDGNMTIHRGDALPFPVLANCPYDRSLRYKQHLEAQTEAAFSDWTKNSSGRFATAAGMLKQPHEQDPIGEVFGILEAVAQGPSTQWRIAYDITGGMIHFKTAANPNVRQISLADFDFSCAGPVLVANIDAPLKGKEDFSSWNESDNFALIDTVCNAVEFLKQIPPEARKATAAYPNSISCAD